MITSRAKQMLKKSNRVLRSGGEGTTSRAKQMLRKFIQIPRGREKGNIQSRAHAKEIQSTPKEWR